jgi:predicted phage tail protein
VITLRYPWLPLNGEIQWGREECAHVPGQSLDVYLGLTGGQIERLVVNGEVVEPENVALCTPLDGDEITFLPVVGGSNRGVLAGILGGIAAVAFVIAFPELAPLIGSSYLAAFGAGFAISTLIYSLAHPARNASGDKTGNTYLFDGITNEDREGVAQPVVFGDELTGGVRVDSFVRIELAADPSDPTNISPHGKSYQLINVTKARWGIESIDEVRINNEPFSNFPSAEYFYTKGETPEQWYDQAGSPIPRPVAFKVSANTFSEHQELTTTPYIYTTSPTSLLTDIELLMAFPAGLVHTHKSSDSDNATRYKVRYKLHSSSTWIPWTGSGFDSTGIREVKKNTHAAYIEPVQLLGLTPGRYDIEVTWVSSDYTSPSGTDIDSWKVFLTGVTEQISNAPARPGYVLLAVAALAVEQLNGTPPTISCRGKFMKVPWHDGTSWQAPTWYGPNPDVPVGRNPAWFCLEMLRDKADASIGYKKWGLGLDDSRIDIPAWVAFAAKCSRLRHVTDDQGHEFDEPMHQLDYTLNEQRPYDTLMRDILGTCRAAPVMSGNGAQHGVFYDDLSDPVQLVTMGNMVAGTFQPVYDFSPRVNTLDVTFRDRDHDFATTTRAVANDHLITTLGRPVNREGVSMLGVTRWSQIAADAFYNLKKHEAAKVPASFEVRTDAILWRVGDVINVQHEQPGWGISGGRMRLDGTTTTVTLSAKAKVVSGATYVIDLDGSEILIDLATKSYEVRVRLADGSGEEGQRRTVSAVSVSSDGYLIATVSTPFTIAPKFQDPCAFGEFGKSVKPYRCLSISKSANAFRKVSLIDYNASVYDPSGPLETIVYSSLPTYGGPPPPIPPGSCTAVEDLSAQNTNVNLSTAVVQWQEPIRASGFGFYGSADVEVSLDSGASWKLLQRVPGTEYRWHAAPHEIALLFRVTPISTNGRSNPNGRAISPPLICHGDQTIPADVTEFSASVSGDAFVWKWPDLSREIQIELRDADANWGTSAGNIYFKGRAGEFKIVGPNVRTITLYAKYFTPFAKYSVNAISATASKSAPGAPAVDSAHILITDDSIKVPVGPVTGAADVTGIYMWASQTSGFSPGSSNRVAQIVTPGGGDFILKTLTPGSWYFRVAATDALTERIGDYAYSAEYTAAIVVVSPQSPTGVTFADSGVAGRHRAVAKSPTGSGSTTLKTFLVFVDWTWSDTVNPASYFLGFQVIVYESGSDPHAPFYTSSILTDVSARSLGIPDLTIESAATYVAAVRAVYTTTSSPFITSTGLALDPASGEVLQGANDRNVGAYADNFASVAVPTGFSKSSTDSWSVSGALTVTAGDRTSTWIQWDLAAWGAAYLDTLRGTFDGFSVMIAIQLQDLVHFANPANPQFSVTVQHGDGGASTAIAQRLVTDRTGYQFYRIDFPNVGNQGTIIAPPASSGPLTVKVDMSGVFSINGLQWDVKGIAVSFDGVTVLFDGHVDRAIQARLQFGKDPLGGFFGIAPVRLTDDVGNITIIDSNGGSFLSVGGQTYKNLKRVVKATHDGINNGQSLFWGAFGGEPGLIIPPAATNKAHILVSQFNASYEDNAPTYRPVRKYLEAVCVNDVNWRVSLCVFEGGVFGKALFNSLGSSAPSKAAMTLDLDISATNNSGSDAWFNSTGRGLPSANYYRTVLWIAATMPSAKRSNGSPYWLTLTFAINSDLSIGTANPMTLAGTGSLDNVTDLTLRALSDGQTWYLPVAYSSNPQSSGSPRSFKVNYSGLYTEGGVGIAPSSVWLDQVNFYYWQPGSGGTAYAAAASDVEFTIAEET